jgi:hypothetical protein
MHQRFAAVLLAAAFGASIGFPGRLAAQQTAPQKSAVTIVQVRPEAGPAWREFQATQTVPALKKAGIAQRDVYESIYAPGGQFRIVQPLAKFADRDNPQSPIARALGDPAFRTYGEALAKLQASSATTIIESIPDASYDPNPNAVYPVLVLTRYHVAPGKAADFLAYVRGERAAAVKKGQTKRELISRVLFGGDNNEFRIASFEDKIGALDSPSPITRALGADGVAKLVTKLAGVVLSSDRTVWRRVEAMSVRPKPVS